MVESSVLQEAQSHDEDIITRQTIGRNAGQQTTAGDRRPQTAVGSHNTVLRLPGAGCSRNANPTSRAGVCHWEVLSLAARGGYRATMTFVFLHCL